MDKSGRMTNILKREDFVNEQSLNEKNEGDIQPLKKYYYCPLNHKKSSPTS